MIWTYFVVGFGLGSMAGAALVLTVRGWEVRLLKGCLRRCEDEVRRLKESAELGDRIKRAGWRTVIPEIRDQP